MRKGEAAFLPRTCGHGRGTLPQFSMVDFVDYSAISDSGWKEDSANDQDFVWVNEKDFGDDLIFVAIADGAGAEKDTFRPSSIAVHEVESMLKKYYKSDPEMLKKYARPILEMSCQAANDVLIAFKLGDEKMRYGYSTTLTCALIQRNGTLVGSHVGNSRFYLIREGRTIQVTKDHTKAQQLVDRGDMDPSRYYLSYEKLMLTSVLGTDNVEIQTFKIKLQENDFILLTTDGVHYTYSDDQFLPTILNSTSIKEASQRIIDIAKETKLNSDDLSDILMLYLGENPKKEGK